MAISDKLSELNTIKTNIRNALVEKGIEDASSHGFSSFAEDISKIISAAEVPIPVLASPLTYNGETQEPEFSGYDSTVMTMSGITSAKEAGTYVTSFALKTGFIWEDKTSSPKSISWDIAVADFTKATMDDIPTQYYTGSEIKPEPTITFNSKVLTKNNDYTVGYENNTNIGTGILTATGITNFSGYISKSFSIIEYARINVTCINNSSLTCTNGTYTYTGTASGNSYTFIIPCSGTWTVTASATAGTYSGSISASAVGATYSIDLLHVYLINGTDGCSSVTGGWVTRAIRQSYDDGGGTNPSISYGSNYTQAYVTGANSQNGLYTTKSQIDLSKYSSLTTVLYGGARYGVWASIRGWSSFGTYCGDNNIWVDYVGDYKTSVHTVTRDLSSITQAAYIGFSLYGREDPGYVQVYSMYLTRNQS